MRPEDRASRARRRSRWAIRHPPHSSPAATDSSVPRATVRVEGWRQQIRIEPKRTCLCKLGAEVNRRWRLHALLLLTVCGKALAHVAVAAVSTAPSVGVYAVRRRSRLGSSSQSHDTASMRVSGSKFSTRRGVRLAVPERTGGSTGGSTVRRRPRRQMPACACGSALAPGPDHAPDPPGRARPPQPGRA
jgi:hypothetical protein